MRPEISTGDAIKELADAYQGVEGTKHPGDTPQTAANRRRRLDAFDLAIQALQAIEKIAGIK